MTKLEILAAWRTGYEAYQRGERNHFEHDDLRAAWEQGHARARGEPRPELQPKLHRELASEMHVSVARVQQIEQRAIRKIKLFVAERPGLRDLLEEIAG